MTKNPVKQFPPYKLVLAALAAWLIPGAGHWYLGRPVRAVVLFLTIQMLFWSGVAIGGRFTVNPREERWWSRAQLCNGAGGLISYYLQSREFARYREKAEQLVEPGLPQREEKVLNQARILLAEDNLALVPPASNPAYVFSGVAGMLNLLCVMDVILLCALGHRGEGPIVAAAEEASA